MIGPQRGLSASLLALNHRVVGLVHSTLTKCVDVLDDWAEGDRGDSQFNHEE